MYKDAKKTYLNLPILQQIPLVLTYGVDKLIDSIPTSIKKVTIMAKDLANNGLDLMCGAIPFIYIYRRDQHNNNDSGLSAQ